MNESFRDRRQASTQLLHTAVGTCDLMVHASPLRDIAPSRQSAGSSASPALLHPITYTSPSARQPIRGVTPGLCFLRDPSRHAIRLAPTHAEHESTCRVTPFPVPMVRIRRTVFSTGFLWQCMPVSGFGCRRLLLCPFGSSVSASCAGSWSRWLITPSLALPIDAC